MADGKKLEVRARFKTASAGESKAGIGFTVDRDQLTLSIAERFLCQKDVEANITVQTEEDIEGQKSFVDTDIQLVVPANITGFSVKSEKFSSRLNFNIADVDLRELARFSGKWGKVELTILPPK